MKKTTPVKIKNPMKIKIKNGTGAEFSDTLFLLSLVSLDSPVKELLILLTKLLIKEASK